MQRRLSAEFGGPDGPELRPDPRHHGPDPRDHQGRRGPQIQRRPVPDEQRAAEPGRPDQEGRLFRRLFERRPVRHLSQRVERPHRPGPALRRTGQDSLGHRAHDKSLSEQRLVQGQPRVAPGHGTCARRADRLVRGQEHQPLRRVRETRCLSGDHAEHRQARPDRNRRGRVQLSVQREQRDHPLRRPGGGVGCPCGHRGPRERVLRHPRERAQRQPHRGNDRRALFRPSRHSDQRSDGHHPHRTHRRGAHHPRARGSSGLAHTDRHRAQRSSGPDLQLHRGQGGLRCGIVLHSQRPVHPGHGPNPRRHHGSAQRRDFR